MRVDEVELRIVRLPYRSVFKTSFAAEIACAFNNELMLHGIVFPLYDCTCNSNVLDRIVDGTQSCVTVPH